MGASLKMRALLWIGLFMIAVSMVSETQAISFDELVSRANEAENPELKEAPVVAEVDPEMEAWSTDHLLGLDEPPPQHMFDSLLNREHHKAHKKMHKAPKVVEKEHKEVKKEVKKAAKLPKVHIQLAQRVPSLLLPVVTATTKKAKKTKAKTIKKVKSVVKEENLLASFGLDIDGDNDDDDEDDEDDYARDIVPEDDEDDVDDFVETSMPNHKAPTNKATGHSLSGLAASMMQRNEKKEEVIKAAAEEKKSQRAYMKKMQKDHDEEIGVHSVHLDLSTDTVDPLDEDDEDSDSHSQALSDLLNTEDDDDFM